MGVASGIGSQVGFVNESTYGTYVAPTKFPVAVAKLKRKQTVVSADGPGAGRLMALGSRRVVTTTSAEGSLEMAVPNKGIGLIIQALMGTSVTPVQQASTTAYLQTHTLADPFGKSLTIQAGVPQAVSGGAVAAYSYSGCKVQGASFTFEVNKEVTASFDIDAQKVVDTQTLAAASYVTGVRPFVGTDGAVKVGTTFGTEASVSGVKKVTVKIDRPMATDRNYMGAAGLKAEPILNDFTKITGTITADFIDKTVWADKFAANTGFYMVLEAVGLNIQSTYYDTFRIVLTQCFLTGETPQADGLDVVSGDFPFEVVLDGTNTPRIDIISTDTTL